MADAHADVSKHVKMYMAVLAALAVGTVLTVVASRVEFGGSMNVVIALAIATVKASLVAAIFMHLKWESCSAIWVTLALCALFFFVLILVPVLVVSDLPPQVQIGIWG